MNTNGTIGRAIAAYSGLPVLAVDIIPDPVVPTVYAVRATLARGRREEPVDQTDARDVASDDPLTMDVLLRGVALHRVTEADIEEVTFTSWPPTSSRS